LVVTLTNGSIITIPVGQNSASVTIESRADDVYVQGNDPLTVGVGGTTGGNYENLNIGSTTTTIVRDDDDAVGVSIKSNGAVTEDQPIAFTVLVDQKLDRDLTVILSNGDTVVIKAGDL